MERRFVKSGIPGLDRLTGGGFLDGSIITISGPTGSGKSTMAAQFLYNGVMESDEPGMYITIEENRQEFFFHMGGYEWDFAKAEKDRRFILLDYPIHEVDQILNQYSAIQEIINSTGVKRVVIDSIMPIALFFHTEDERKKGLLKLIENIRKWNVTTIIVSEDIKPTKLGVLPTSSYGIESYSDVWINLFYKYDEKKMDRVRFAEVLKMKGVGHSLRAYPAVITNKGISIMHEAAPPVLQEKKEEREKPVKAAPSKPAPAKPISQKSESKESITSRLAAAKSRLLKKSK